MARFRYNLQNILDIKLKMETQARQEFSASKIALDEEIEKKNRLLNEKRDLESESRKILLGRLNIHDIEDNALSRILKEQEVARQEDSIVRARRNLEEARNHLNEVMMERKTHEKLREKAFANFLVEENRAESKVVDELTSYVYGQKKGQD